MTGALLRAGVSALAVLLATLPATAQSMQLRGNVEDADKKTSPLDRKAIADRSTMLTQSGADKEKAREAREAATKVYLPESEGAVSEEELESGTSAERLDGRPQAPRLPIGARERSREDEEASALREEVAKQTRAARTAEPQDILTGTVRAAPQPAEDEERNTRTPANAERAGPVEGLDRQSEEDPYAPVGLRLGSFTVLPSLETGLSYSDNVLSSPVKEKGLTSETTLRLNATSDWPVHQATVNGFATWRESLSGPDRSEPEAGLDGTLRLDLADSHALTAKAAYGIKREDAESPVPLPANAGRPLQHSLEASLGLARTDGRLRYGVTGAVEREAFGDADLAGGGTLSQKERDFTLAKATLRLGYEVSPALVPFVEGEYGRRFYDQSRDASGYRRSADRMALRAGVETDLGEKLKGEIAAGWQRETADDPRLKPVSGLSLLANLDWSPQRGTTLSLTGESTVEGTTTAASSGSLLHSGTLAIAHRLRANLTANAQFTASLRDYVGAAGGRDVTLAGQLGFTWWLNRNLGITTRLRHERLDSTLPNRDTATNSAFVGMKWQH